MPRVYNVKLALIGAVFDANRLLNEGKIKTAFNVLKKRLEEIEKMESVDWAKTNWR